MSIFKEKLMLSFHNDPKVKEKYLNRVKKNRELYNIIQGIGWKNGKGCAVGCTLESYDHSRYPIELGLPEWLARLEDRIFEKLPKEEAMLWPEKFLESIPVGVNVEEVRHKLAIIRMDNLINIQNEFLQKNPNLSSIFIKVISFINLVKNCHELELNKQYCDWSAAKAAAWAAVWSEDFAAWAASWSSEWSAESAESAIWSSAESAENSTARAAEWSVASSAAWKKEADNLIELLHNCK